MSLRAGRLALTVAGLGLLAAGCAPGGAGFAAGGEGCGQQLGSFNGAGQAFLAPAAGPATWGSRQPATNTNFGRGAPAAAPGGALQATLAQENADLDAVQIAFDALLYCRWIEARTIRAELAAGRTPRPLAESRMAALRARLQRDLARAQAVLESLERRDAERASAVEAAAPGVRRAAAAARSGTGNTRRVVAAATVPLRLRPEAGAPEIGRVPAGQLVSVRPAQSGFALVEGQGLRGYAPSGAFQVAERAAPQAAAIGPGGQVRVLAASNIAKRDNFAESLALAREAAVSGFELAT